MQGRILSAQMTISQFFTIQPLLIIQQSHVLIGEPILWKMEESSSFYIQVNKMRDFFKNILVLKRLIKGVSV